MPWPGRRRPAYARAPLGAACEGFIDLVHCARLPLPAGVVKRLRSGEALGFGAGNYSLAAVVFALCPLPPTTAQYSFASCQRTLGAFRVGGSSQDTPCTTSETRGLTPVTGTTKFVFGCHDNGAVLCDGDGAGTGAYPADCQTLGLMDCSAHLDGTTFSPDMSTIYVLCTSKVYRCDWDAASATPISNCGLITGAECPQSGSESGVFVPPSDGTKLILSCSNSGSATSAGLLKCPFTSAGSGTLAGGCTLYSDKPCGASHKWYEMISLDSFGKLSVSCAYATCMSCDFTVSSGTSGCTSIGTEPFSDVTRIVELASGRTAVTGKTEGYKVCGTPKPTTAPTAVPSGPTVSPSVPPSPSPTTAPVDPTLAPSHTPSLPPSAGPSEGPTAPTPGPSTPPTLAPSGHPSTPPSPHPTAAPSASPLSPTPRPSTAPAYSPSAEPSAGPSLGPTRSPTQRPTRAPTAAPTLSPSKTPSRGPANPTVAPTAAPVPPPGAPTRSPVVPPTRAPSRGPTLTPSAVPSVEPTRGPTQAPSSAPTGLPTAGPSASPTVPPSGAPSGQPSLAPSVVPSGAPTVTPTSPPSRAPSAVPSSHPTSRPSSGPTQGPSTDPTTAPSAFPTRVPSLRPSEGPSGYPTPAPTASPSLVPSAAPTGSTPTMQPTRSPSITPTQSPTGSPSAAPSGSRPTTPPSLSPSRVPSQLPTTQPLADPSPGPSRAPSAVPSLLPTLKPLPPSSVPSSLPSAAETVPTYTATLVPSPPPPPSSAVAPGGTTDDVVAGLSVATGAGGAAGPLVMAMDTGCEELGMMQNLSAVLHPTGIKIGGSPYLGCLCGNALLVLGAALLSFAALRAMRALDRDGDGSIGGDDLAQSRLKDLPPSVLDKVRDIDVGAVIRHPNNILLVALFLYQGTSFCALRLLVAPRGPDGAQSPVGARVAGGLVAVALVAVPVQLFRYVRRGVGSYQRRDLPELGARKRARIRAWDDPKPPRWLQWVLLSEDGDWVSCRKQKHWINQWQSAVRHFSARFAATGAATELIAMWILSLCNAFPTETWRACGHVRMAGAAVHFAQLVYCSVTMPYRCFRDNAARIILLLALITALSSIALSFYAVSGDYDGLSHAELAAKGPPAPDTHIGSFMLFGATAIVLLQVLLRVLAELVLLLKGWRTQLQRNEWAEFEAHLETVRAVAGAVTQSSGLSDPPEDGAQSADDASLAGSVPLIAPAPALPAVGRRSGGTRADSSSDLMPTPARLAASPSAPGGLRRARAESPLGGTVRVGQHPPPWTSSFQDSARRGSSPRAQGRKGTIVHCSKVPTPGGLVRFDSGTPRLRLRSAVFPPRPMPRSSGASPVPDTEMQPVSPLAGSKTPSSLFKFSDVGAAPRSGLGSVSPPERRRQTRQVSVASDAIA
eukprot:TRINITY_DN14442_c1_g1_i2.p1 TRINITY_DN14442_c1_g1~~TRINITY_DN14442_c1_g1_i2.p1  ORF type:complete len:1396 (+),score=71.00 TRINITY_DN14442_c1_g1_i2:81-4268(+)